jgi:hypothetical protein
MDQKMCIQDIPLNSKLQFVPYPVPKGLLLYFI